MLAGVLIIVILFAAGCGPRGRGDERTSDGRHPYTHPHELRFATATDISHLNPLLGATLYEDYLTSLCMAYFTKADARGNPTVPELVTEVPSRENGDVSHDGKTITWHLRHGVRWSDGVPFTAADVVFTTKQILNPANNVESTEGWNLIVRIDAPDKYTVVYHLRKPYAAFAYVFFFGAGLAVLPEHLLRGVHDLNTAAYNSLPVGIGPFRFQSWKRGESVVMVRNPYYFRGPPKLDRIVFKIIPDTNTALAELRSHELDLWLGIPPHFYRQTLALDGILGLATPSNAFDHLDFNLANPILADVRVRRALRLALDRRDIVDKTQSGLYRLDESPVTPASPYHENLALVPFDIVRANALLEAAGWRRGLDGIRTKRGMRLNLTYVQQAGRPDLDTESELIRSTWERIGVDVRVKRYLPSQLFATARDGGIIFGGKYDVARFLWALTPDESLESLYGCNAFPPGGQNDMHWCDPLATAAMERQDVDLDECARANDLAVVQRRVYDQVPTVVLDFRVQLSAYNSDLRNWDPKPMSPPFDDMMNVDI
jgi:peptide/nickel transport system substrate-binding protein